jgi:hypothetical protein
LPPNVTGQNADLYNETYAKVVDDNSAANSDPANNKMTVIHTNGRVYTDIFVTCLLDYGEPPGQQAFDNSTNFNGEYVFDASTVSDLGDGNNAAGARKLDMFRKNIRKHKRGGKVNLPPRVKSLESYLRG